MKVQNMTSNSGNTIANQFIITGSNDIGSYEIFQSYRSTIIKVQHGMESDGAGVFLDENKWDYSRTTGKYRNQFLGETKRETEAKIKSGEYKLVNLN